MKISYSPIQMADFFAHLSKNLEKQLPGPAAQAIMSPSIRDYSLKSNDRSAARNSGVLLLLYPKEEQIHTCLIKRSTGTHNHSGQMSLPGGKYEKTDASLIHTALREAQEELGIPSGEVQILGCLSQLYIPVSNFHVLPVVGVLNTPPDFIPNTFEVQQLVEVPLHQLFAPANIREQEIIKNGITIRAPYFDAKGHKVWGATAMILSELNELLKNSKQINW